MVKLHISQASIGPPSLAQSSIISPEKEFIFKYHTKELYDPEKMCFLHNTEKLCIYLRF